MCARRATKDLAPKGPERCARMLHKTCPQRRAAIFVLLSARNSVVSSLRFGRWRVQTYSRAVRGGFHRTSSRSSSPETVSTALKIQRNSKRSLDAARHLQRRVHDRRLEHVVRAPASVHKTMPRVCLNRKRGPQKAAAGASQGRQRRLRPANKEAWRPQSVYRRGDR